MDCSGFVNGDLKAQAPIGTVSLGESIKDDEAGTEAPAS